MANDSEQLSMFNKQDDEQEDKPVTVLGMTFKNDQERREYFTEELRKKLPELKTIEGFPIGEDEDILALSDPPYYTMCPNPWIQDFVNNWSSYDQIQGKYLEKRSPFATDVKEGKNDPIYNAHSYHTKVPYKAIMRFLLHYTKPGDIIFDGFSGTGMTGVAAQMCGVKEEVEELGFEVTKNNEILNNKSEYISSLGFRNAILTELSPSGSFISLNYNKPTQPNLLNNLNNEIRKFKNNFNWAYLTLNEDYKGEVKGLVEEFRDINLLNNEETKAFFEKHRNKFNDINYIVWSDIYICPNCSNEINYWKSTVEKETKKVTKNLYCENCALNAAKKDCPKLFVNNFDKYTGEVVKQPKNEPVLINYSVNKKRFEKELDEFDILLIEKIENLNIPYWFPKEKLEPGVKTNEAIRNGITYTHHFYVKRHLLLLSAFLKEINIEDKQLVQFLLGSILPKINKMNRYMPQHGSRALVGPMANALYFPPMSVENNVLDQIVFQFKKIAKALNSYAGNLISTQSSTHIQINDNSVDYIFLDPPFGANIMYSELSFLRESWLGIVTNNTEEVIENKFQDKDIGRYTKLMESCLTEAFRILKPGKYMTVEFSNTKANVWNSIQHAIQEAGFVVASVDALDKKRGGLHSMISTTAVKQDLIITAYKPLERVQKLNLYENSSTENVMLFVRNHLEHLPIIKEKNNELQFIAERDVRIIYDRMIAYFVRMGNAIPVSSNEFQDIIQKYFPIRDGMVFLENQVLEYDKKRITVKEFQQMTLFISDEKTAIEWIRQQLMKKPQSRQDLHPSFMKEIQHIDKHELLPELDQLLEQNFLQYNGKGDVPDQIASYLKQNYKNIRGLDNDHPDIKKKATNRWYVPNPNKQADLEKLRERSLVREFEAYVDEISNSRKKLKQFRTEAIRAGFKRAWSDKDYQKIVDVGERLPEKVIQEDDKLLMYFDNAQIRLGL
mgnify:CR=1 FL=1